MPRFNSQAGLAPVVVIIGLLSLGAVVAGGYFAFKHQKSNQAAPIPQAIQAPIEQVKEAYESNLLKMDGVKSVEVGEKDKKPCIVVFTFKETDDLKKLENNGIDGYEVKIENSAPTQ